MTDGPKYPDIDVQLTGTSGNTGALMGLVSGALRDHGVPSGEISEFRMECLSGDYDHALQTMMRWVNVE